MAIYKRGSTWWTDFSVNGQRFRQSLDTSDWREAQAKEKELIAQAHMGKLAPSSQQFARLSFSEAAERFLADRLPYLAPRSIQTEKERLRPLKAYLGTRHLTSISAELIRQYIAHRKATGVSNKTVNLELALVRGILKRAKRWHLVADEIRPLPVRRNVGRALSDDEKVRLLKAAATKPDWQLARLAMTLSLNTTMRACEIKGLRWRDVSLTDHVLTIKQSKTAAGERVIPLNADAMEAVMELRDRATAFGGNEPDHFVFPACESGRIEPSVPQKSWRTAWRGLTRAADLQGLRFHDLRHHAITELAESLASDQTIMSIAGHVSRQMLEHYSHVRLKKKRHALDALSGKSSAIAASEKTGYGTSDDTKTHFEGDPTVVSPSERPET
jgi:integrase